MSTENGLIIFEVVPSCGFHDWVLRGAFKDARCADWAIPFSQSMNPRAVTKTLRDIADRIDKHFEGHVKEPL